MQQIKNETKTGRTQLNESHTRKGSEREKVVQNFVEPDHERERGNGRVVILCFIRGISVFNTF